VQELQFRQIPRDAIADVGEDVALQLDRFQLVQLLESALKVDMEWLVNFWRDACVKSLTQGALPRLCNYIRNEYPSN